MLKQLLILNAFLFLCLSAKAQTPAEILLNFSKESVEKLNSKQQIQFREVDTRIDSFHQFDFVNENWNDVPLGRGFYSYDADDNNHLIEFYELDETTNTYNLTQIVDQVFEGSLVDSAYIRVLDEDTGMFNTLLIQANTYNDDDLLAVQWQRIDFGFILLYAQSYLYYSQDNRLDSLKQDISFDGITFEPSATVIYEYDDEDNLTTSLTTAVNQAGQIENNARDSSVYDTYNRRIEYFSWEWDVDNNLWIPESSVKFNNDEYGTVQVEFQKIYDLATESFQNELKTEYFFDYLSSINETVSIDCSMLNPSNGLIQLSCPELSDYKNLVLQVYDMTGRLLVTKGIDTNNNISFNSGLKSGTYVVLLSSENYPMVSKKLIVR